MADSDRIAPAALQAEQATLAALMKATEVAQQAARTFLLAQTEWASKLHAWAKTVPDPAVSTFPILHKPVFDMWSQCQSEVSESFFCRGQAFMYHHTPLSYI